VRVGYRTHSAHVVAVTSAALLAFGGFHCKSADPAGEPAGNLDELLPAPVEYGFGLVLEPLVEVGEQLTFLTHAGDGSGRLFLTTRAGRIRVFREGALAPEPFLDIADLVEDDGLEQGLLGLAFAPDFAQSGVLYVNYTAVEGGRTVVARLRVTAGGERADPASLEEVLTFAQPAANHNGGHVAFGPDGFLYVGTGDGGGRDDQFGHAQDLGSLLGKLLRLDVAVASSYAVPPDNPFVGTASARPEIWAYGLRNPWCFAFDRATGDLYIADVGQNAFEEVNFQAAGSGGGENYGWSRLEGFHCFRPRGGCDATGTVLPVAEYGHDLGCSVTGGYVYRGQREPRLTGIYLFGDFCSGRIFGLRRTPAGTFELGPLYPGPVALASFGEDEQGEVYAVDLQGEVFRLTIGGGP
jgi:glucose/arabinose dehydrogenase